MLFKLPFINFIRGDNTFNKFGRSVLGHFKRIWIIKDILSVRDDLCKKIRSSAVHLFPFLCIQVETPKETKSWIFHHFFCDYLGQKPLEFIHLGFAFKS